jgi:acetyl esterase/lipase
VIVAANLTSANAPPAMVALGLGLIFALQVAAGAIAAVWPTSQRLTAAALAAFVAAALWQTGQAAGFPDAHGALWRLESTAIPDLYAGLMAAAAGVVFAVCAVLCWPHARPWVRRLAVGMILVAVAALAAAGLGSARAAQIFAVVLVLDGGVPRSLLHIALPAAGVVFLLGVGGSLSPSLKARTGLGWRGGLALALALPVLTLFGWGGEVAGRESAWLARETPISVGPGKEATLAFCWPNSRPLALDIARRLGDGPAPLIVYIHGGETLQGSRALDDGGPDGPWFIRLRSDLLARGFAVASVDYRLAPFHPVPNEITDVRCALDFLRAHAVALGLDPGRVGLMGPSQGGYLSSMLGLAGQAQAVVDMWGPADLGDFRGSPSWVAAVSGLPSHPSPERLAQIRAASPLYNVRPGAPPFLILHGQDDWFVAPHHSDDLAARLKATGGDVTLVRIAGDGHGLTAVSKGQREAPTPDVLIADIADFFTRTLKPRR